MAANFFAALGSQIYYRSLRPVLGRSGAVGLLEEAALDQLLHPRADRVAREVRDPLQLLTGVAEAPSVDLGDEDHQDAPTLAVLPWKGVDRGVQAGLRTRGVGTEALEILKGLLLLEAGGGDDDELLAVADPDRL